MKRTIILWSIGVLFALTAIVGMVTLATYKPASDTSIAPPTQVVTPTPLTYEQRVEAAISLDGSKVTFDAKTGEVVVTYYLGEILNYDSGVTLAKMNIFDVEKAIWNDGLHAVNSVTVHITTNLIDSYGHTSVGDIARATLTKNTASQFVWSNLDQDSAWNVYDSTWLLPNN